MQQDEQDHGQANVAHTFLLQESLVAETADLAAFMKTHGRVCQNKKSCPHAFPILSWMFTVALRLQSRLH